MATKNVIEEYFIKITADAKGVEKDINSALSRIKKNTEKVNQSLAKTETKIKANTIAQKTNQDKEYNLVQDALRKKNLADEQAASKREIDLAKIAYKRKSYFIKNAAEKISDTNNHTLKEMKKFYQEQERMAKKAADQQLALKKKIQSYKETDYYRRVQEANPMAAAKYDRDFKNARDINEIKDVAREVRRASRDMTRSMNGLAFAQNGLRDSTRNMIRSYISLFALFEGTRAIKNVGMDFQSMESSMLAAAGSTSAAIKDVKFIDSIVNEMGLSLKDTTDAWVKFKFAAQGKISQKEQEDIFTSLSMFGTSLKVGTEDMKRSQRAIIQMMSKGKLMAEELKNQLKQQLSCLIQKCISEKLL